MNKTRLYRLATVCMVFTFIAAVTACFDGQTEGGNAVSKLSIESTTDAPVRADLIARVGDEEITFSQLNTMLNSSAMVGLSIPALGTPERNQVIITLLDKAISANLLYLDAKQKGTDRLLAYTEEVKQYEDAILASLYRSKYLIGDIPVSEQEIKDYYAVQVSKDTELTDDVRLAIEAKIRKQKLKQLKATQRERLREGVSVNVDERVLDADYDSKRSDADTVATVGERRITWSEVKALMFGADRRASRAAFYIDDDVERQKRLDLYIDNTIMASLGRSVGLEGDPAYINRTAEFRKTRLINLHRDNLISSWKPSDDEIKSYFMDHLDSISVPESRKVQMVVVKSREQAESIKSRIDKGEMTVYQAAKEYSIDPNAKYSLGEMGWVRHGTGFKALDDFTFSIEPEVLSGPVESPAGWHLVKVLDVTDAVFQNIDDADTHKRTLRKYMQDRFAGYVIDLRKYHFPVSVYDAELSKNFQKEADYIAALSNNAQQEGSITRQRQEELEKWITRPVMQ